MSVIENILKNMDIEIHVAISKYLMCNEKKPTIILMNNKHYKNINNTFNRYISFGVNTKLLKLTAVNGIVLDIIITEKVDEIKVC